MRALITGGRGFVGKWLAEHLVEAGDDVVVIDHEVEITDADAVNRAIDKADPDAVYHLAALTHVGDSWQNPAAVLQVNAVGTFNVLSAARSRPTLPRVLLVSSSEVYGVVPEDRLPVGEDWPLAPVTPYAASKVAAEYLGVQAHLAYGLPVVRVRPFNHIGPGQSATFAISALATRVVDAERSGAKQIPVGNLSARRDLTDVRDVVRSYRALVCDGTPGEVYNVCSGRAVAISEVAERLLAAAGIDLELVVDPGLMRPVDVPVILGDASKLRSATRWALTYDLDTTLRDVLDYWRGQPA